MSEELKPCPFCGGNIFKKLEVSGGPACWFHCRTCGANGAVRDTEQQAIDAWNRRINEERF